MEGTREDTLQGAKKKHFGRGSRHSHQSQRAIEWRRIQKAATQASEKRKAALMETVARQASQEEIRRHIETQTQREPLPHEQTEQPLTAPTGPRGQGTRPRTGSKPGPRLRRMRQRARQRHLNKQAIRSEEINNGEIVAIEKNADYNLHQTSHRVFGFVTDSSKLVCDNTRIILETMSPQQYYTRPGNMAFHYLWTTAKTDGWHSSITGSWTQILH